MMVLFISAVLGAIAVSLVGAGALIAAEGSRYLDFGGEDSH
jgi:hypothetical protein